MINHDYVFRRILQLNGTNHWNMPELHQGVQLNSFPWRFPWQTLSFFATLNTTMFPWENVCRQYELGQCVFRKFSEVLVIIKKNEERRMWCETLPKLLKSTRAWIETATILQALRARAHVTRMSSKPYQPEFKTWQLLGPMPQEANFL